MIAFRQNNTAEKSSSNRIIFDYIFKL